MSFFTREQRYEMLCAIKQGTQPGTPLTEEEEQFIQRFAKEMFDEIMRDPEVLAVMQRLKLR